MNCQKCNTEAVQVIRKDSISAGGCLGALIFLLALPMLLFDMLIGFVMVIVAILIGNAGRGQHVELVCPKCKTVVSKVK